MGWLGLSILVSLIAMAMAYYNGRRLPTDWDDIKTAGIVIFFLGAGSIGAIGGMYCVTSDGRLYQGDDNSHCEASAQRWNIVSAVREKSVTSSFILGTGGSRTIDRYYAYQEESRGLMLKTYSTYKTYVIEQDGEPYYERIDYICPMPVYDFLWWSTGNTNLSKGRYGTLYVPPGTILRKFEM